MTTYSNTCYCQKIRVDFETAKKPEELNIRECQCEFCLRHGAVYTSDPSGKVTIHATNDDLIRYQFGTKTADFLLCKHCGTFIGAVMNKEGNTLSVINIKGLQIAPFDILPYKSADYEGENVNNRLGRRSQNWTPTSFA